MIRIERSPFQIALVIGKYHIEHFRANTLSCRFWRGENQLGCTIVGFAINIWKEY